VNIWVFWEALSGDEAPIADVDTTGAAVSCGLPQRVQNFAPGRLNGAPQWMQVADSDTMPSSLCY